MTGHDPRDNVGVHVGSEIRYLREHAGMTQKELAENTHYAHSTVAMIEIGDRLATPDFLKAAAEVLNAGHLARFAAGLVKDRRFNVRFRPWVAVEQDAVEIVNFEPLVVPGLLQTEDYARSIISAVMPSSDKDVGEMVQGRMDRKAMLVRDTPLVLVAVIGEGVLPTLVGTAAVMAEQMAALLEAGEQPHVHVQVLPSDTGAHPGLGGAFAIATLRDGSHVVLLDDIAQGQVTSSPDDIRFGQDAMSVVRANALPEKMSAERIREVMDQWKTRA